MKIECEITNVRTSKKGDTITIFVAKEHRKHVVDGIMPFIERPVTLELMIDAKKVLENMDRITEEQRKKAYALLKDFAKEYGDTPENIKQMLKDAFKSAYGKDISLSDCDTETASEFIEFVLMNARSMGYEFAHNEIKNASSANLVAKKCFVCGELGLIYGNDQGKLCLCDNHRDESIKIGSKEFMKLYHLELV